MGTSVAITEGISNNWVNKLDMLIRQLSPWFNRIRTPRWQKVISILKTTVLTLSVIGLGIMLGLLLTGSLESQKFIIAAISCLAGLLLTMAYPVYGLVLVIVLNPLNYTFAIIDLGIGIPNMTLDRIVIFFLLALFFLQATTGQRQLHFTNIKLAVFLFLVTYYLSFQNYEWTTNRVLQFLLDKWIFPFFIFFLLANLVDTKRKLDISLNLLLILGFYSAIYMIYENVTGNILFEYRDSFGSQFYGDSNLRITRGLYGTTSTFGNLFNLLIPINLYYFLKARTANQKIWYILVFGLMLVGVYLTYKRSVWLALPLNFLVIQSFYPQFRKLFLVILFVSVLGMAVSWNTIIASEAVSTRVVNTDDWQDANGRTQRWDAGMELWRQYPIFGAGFRSYSSGPYLQVENLYIHFLASAGLITFIPFIMILLIILKNSIKIFLQANKNDRLFIDRNLIPVFWGGLAAYLFMAYFGSNVEGHPISNFTFFAIAGILIGSQVPLLKRPAQLLSRQ